MILLSGLDTELFWSALLDGPSRLFGATQVYVAPGEEAKIEAHPELGEMGEWLCSRGAAARALAQRRAVVYTFEPQALRNITRAYASTVPAAWLEERPRLIVAGLPVYEKDLGAGWYEPEGAFRWMGKRAEVLLAGPARAGERLLVAGFCPASQGDTPIELTVTAEGIAVGQGTDPAGGRFVRAQLQAAGGPGGAARGSLHAGSESDRGRTHALMGARWGWRLARSGCAERLSH